MVSSSSQDTTFGASKWHCWNPQSLTSVLCSRIPGYSLPSVPQFLRPGIVAQSLVSFMALILMKSSWQSPAKSLRVRLGYEHPRGAIGWCLSHHTGHGPEVTTYYWSWPLGWGGTLPVSPVQVTVSFFILWTRSGSLGSGDIKGKRS